MSIRGCIVLPSLGSALIAVVLVTIPASAQEYRVKVVDEKPPVDLLSEEIGASLQSQSITVVDDQDSPLCEIWLRKHWQIVDPAPEASDILYPFEPGELIGVLRFAKRNADFREQPISKGLYTLRYALQPVDGNHVGTSPTRDFLLLVRAKDDTSLKNFDPQELLTVSAAAARTAHPAMLALRKPPEKTEKALLEHREADETWVLSFAGEGKHGDLSRRLAVSLVVEGHAQE